MAELKRRRTRPGWLTRNLVVLSGVSFLQDAASELLYPVLPICLTNVLGAPPAVVGAVEGLAEGAASVTKLGAGALGDRYRKRPLIATGYGLAALGEVLVAAAGAWPAVLAGRVVDRFGKGIRGAPRDALLVEGIPETARPGIRAAPGGRYPRRGRRAAPRPCRVRTTRSPDPPIVRHRRDTGRARVLLVTAVRERPKTDTGARRRELVHRARDLPRSYWRATAVLPVFGLVNFPDALLLLGLSEIGFS